MKKIKILLSVLLLIIVTIVNAQSVQDDSLLLFNKKNEIINKPIKEKIIVINEIYSVRKNSNILFNIQFELLSKLSAVSIQILENNIPIKVKYLLIGNNLSFLLAKDKEYKVLFFEKNSEIEIVKLNTNLINTSEPIEMYNNLYDELVKYSVNREFDNILISNYIVNNNNITPFGKLFFIQRHLLRGKNFSAKIEDQFDIIMKDGLLDDKIKVGNQKKKRDNPWELLIKDKVLTVDMVEDNPFYSLEGCNCSYAIRVNSLILPVALNAGLPLNTLVNQDENAYDLQPITSVNNYNGDPLNIDSSGVTWWADGVRTEFGVAKNMAIWQSGWADWLYNAGIRNNKISTFGSMTSPTKPALNYNQVGYHLFCTNQNQVKADCGCAKKLDVKFKYDNSLSVSVDLHGSGHSNSKSGGIVYDNAIAFATNLYSKQIFIADFGLHSVTDNCQMTKTPDFLAARSNLINSIGGLVTSSLKAYSVSQGNFMTLLDSMDAVTALVSSATTMVNNISTLRNTEKYTSGSCSGSITNSVGTPVNIMETYFLYPNQPMQFTLASQHELEMNGERSFRTSVGVTSGGFISTYLNPDEYVSPWRDESCCSDRYGRWCSTSFGPISPGHYGTEIGAHLTLLAGVFNSNFTTNVFGNYNIFGNIGRIIGGPNENCKSINILGRKPKTLEKEPICIVDNGTMKINITYSNLDVPFAIIDLNGNIVKQGIAVSNQISNVDVSNLAHGIYIVKFVQVNKSNNIKIKI